MTFNQLSKLFLSWGRYVKPDQYDSFKDYLKEMMRRNRVMIISNDEEIEAIVMFHLTNDYDKLYRKGLWDIPEDEPEGSQIYIDKMVCKKWTLGLRRKLQETIETFFPNVLEGYYHRGPYDRCVKIYRRGTKLCTV